MLTIKDTSSEAVNAMIVLHKKHEVSVINAIVRCVDGLGHRRTVLKSHQELAIKSLKHAVYLASSAQSGKNGRPRETVLENFKRGDTAYNGAAERSRRDDTHVEALR